MTGQSILGSIDSLIISTGGRAIIPDTCSSQPICAVELISSRSPVMPEWSFVPNTFRGPDTQSYPSCSTYDKDMSTNLNEEFDYHHNRDALVGIPPPCSMLEYLKQYQTCLDSRGNRRVWTKGNALQVLHCLGQRYDRDVSEWAELWTHWGGRCTLWCCCVGKETNSTFVHCW